MTIYGQSEEPVSRCVECDLAEPESLASLGGSAPGLVDGILSLGIYKQAGGQAIDCEEQIINDVLASPCVSSEHTIGMWKGRFPWLHSICMKITSSKMGQ